MKRCFLTLVQFIILLKLVSGIFNFRFRAEDLAATLSIVERFNLFKQNVADSEIHARVFDFIIVGSGPAGCVLANRLSEQYNWTILLIEAGTDGNIVSDTPILTPYLQQTKYNWGYVAQRQAGSCWGMIGGRCAFPRGRGFGGSSLINYMIYNRGNKRDFDRWEAAGNTGWSYKDVLPYFLKSERSRLTFNSPYHNRFGALSVENVQHRTPFATTFLQAHQYFGYPIIDYNGESQVGAGYLQSTTFFGRRHDASKAFLQPIKRFRPNLNILSNTLVTRILIDPRSKTAYGVEYLRNNRRYYVTARKEVILSAGAFSSAQLLMLSGIGPKEELRRIRVPLIQNLPVGQIMYDHVSFFGPTYIMNTSFYSPNGNRGFGVIDAVLDFKKNNRGALTMPGGLEALSFLKSKNPKYTADIPDIELMFAAGSIASDGGTAFKVAMRITDEIYDAIYRPLDRAEIDSCSVIVMPFHPRSIGYMRLRSNNILDEPLLYSNYFKNEEDVELMLEGIKYSIKLFESPPFKRQFNARINNRPIPGCRFYRFGSDDYWRCAIRTMSTTINHQIGTCPMGLFTNPRSVVSPRLKVHGINRLRVADTSVIPDNLTGHPNAASYMIGEKAADLIKWEWGVCGR